jgi:hypothetical protein
MQPQVGLCCWVSSGACVPWARRGVFAMAFYASKVPSRLIHPITLTQHTRTPVAVPVPSSYVPTCSNIFSSPPHVDTSTPWRDPSLLIPPPCPPTTTAANAPDHGAP